MSIATAINDLSGRIQDAYTALEAKGATMPVEKDTWHLSTTIDTIPAGEATKYGVGINNMFGDVVNGELHPPTEQFSATFSGVSTVTSVDALYFMFAYKPISSVSFPDLQTIDIAYGMQGTFFFSAVHTASFPMLSSIAQNSFYNAFTGSQISSIVFPSLTNIPQYGLATSFSTCQNLIYAEFPALQTINANLVFNNAFSNCPNMEYIRFDNLTSMGQVMDIATFAPFTYCQFRVFYAPKLSAITTSNIFNNCSRLAEFHFGAENQAAIEASKGYATLWGRGAGNATVYFDL